MNLGGEQLSVGERLVTSPVAGTFVPLDAVPDHIEIDEVIGHVRTGDSLVAVRSPFRGRVIEIVATGGQRLKPHERIAWLRLA